MIIYESEQQYIESATDLAAKIVLVDAIILALFDAALRAAAGDDVSEYSLDDGQTKVKATRRGAAGIQTSILAYQRIRQMYINDINGRVTRLYDSKNFTG